MAEGRRRRGFYRIDEGQSLDQYLGEIGKIPLLGRDEERALARRAREGDRRALDELVLANLRFVISVAKQYQNQGMGLVDLINEGNVGLIKAAKRFDEARGFKFISYAVWWIRQAILRVLAEQSRIVRLPLNRVGTLQKISKTALLLEQEYGREPSPEEIARELELSEAEVSDTLTISSTHLSLDAPFSTSEDQSLIDVLPDEEQKGPDEDLMADSMKLEIKKALDTLKPREARVVSLYFGIDQPRALTLDEIGVRFNITRERVRQIKELALRRLRHASRSRTLKSFID